MILQALIIVVVGAFLATVLVGAPYVPSKRSNLKKAFKKLYKISPDDLLVDVGSGGGVVLREVSRLGARALGYEINPFLFAVSKSLSIGDKKIRVRFESYWLAKLPKETTVVYAFSVERDINKIGRWLQSEANRLNKSISLISLGFGLKDVKPIKKSGVYYLYAFNPLQPDKAQV